MEWVRPVHTRCMSNSIVCEWSHFCCATTACTVLTQTVPLMNSNWCWTCSCCLTYASATHQKAHAGLLQITQPPGCETAADAPVDLLCRPLVQQLLLITHQIEWWPLSMVQHNWPPLAQRCVPHLLSPVRHRYPCWPVSSYVCAPCFCFVCCGRVLLLPS